MVTSGELSEPLWNPPPFGIGPTKGPPTQKGKKLIKILDAASCWPVTNDGETQQKHTPGSEQGCNLSARLKRLWDFVVGVVVCELVSCLIVFYGVLVNLNTNFFSTCR